MQERGSMFTTGYDITTAATNVFNAIVTAILAWKVFRDIRPDYRKQLWLTVFFFVLSYLYLWCSDTWFCNDK